MVCLLAAFFGGGGGGGGGGGWIPKGAETRSKAESMAMGTNEISDDHIGGTKK